MSMPSDNDTMRQAAEREHKGWIDEFGNVFPLGAHSTTGRLSWLDAHKRGWKPLYASAAPAEGAREPLTEAQIAAIAEAIYAGDSEDFRADDIRFTRAIEAAHGIAARGIPHSTKDTE